MRKDSNAPYLLLFSILEYDPIFLLLLQYSSSSSSPPSSLTLAFCPIPPFPLSFSKLSSSPILSLLQVDVAFHLLVFLFPLPLCCLFVKPIQYYFILLTCLFFFFLLRMDYVDKILLTCLFFFFLLWFDGYLVIGCTFFL